jgi:DNA gyrase subunit B
MGLGIIITKYLQNGKEILLKAKIDENEKKINLSKMDNEGNKVVDNGRGMPVDKDEKTGLPFPVLACTKLGTSGKFNLKVKAYKNSSGTHGIGITAVTFLSDFTVLRTHRNGKAYEYVFTTDFNTGIVNTLKI